MDVKDFLAQLKWDPFFKDELEFIHIAYIHRGAPGDQKYIPFSAIKEIDGKFLVIEDTQEETVQIPMHRIVSIMNMRTNQVYFRNKLAVPD